MGGSVSRWVGVWGVEWVGGWRGVVWHGWVVVMVGGMRRRGVDGAVAAAGVAEMAAAVAAAVAPAG